MKLIVNEDHKRHSSLEKTRNEEVVHIIENMPTKFGWYVSIIVVFIMCLTLALGWIVKYPDVLKGQITINNRLAPIKLVSNTSGNLALLNSNGSIVKKGDYIGYIKNGANVNDVRKIAVLLETIDIHKVNYDLHRHLLPENISVGELNQDYFGLLNSLYQYLDYLHGGSFKKQVDILRKQILSQNSLLASENDNYIDESEKYKIENDFYKRDSILFAKKVISSQEFEQSKQNLVTKKQQYHYLKKNITNVEYSIKDIQNKIEQLDVEHVDKEHNLEVNMFHSYYQLKETIHEWEHKYIFSAPITGKIAYLTFLKDDDFLESGKEIFSVIPSERKMFGMVLLPETGAGKVAVGQDVIVKLDNFPYAQFGSIKGRVLTMSSVTNDAIVGNNVKQSNYLLTVSLPNQLRTNYGTTLSFRNQAKGTAEIITDKRRLIERLFDNLKHSIK